VLYKGVKPGITSEQFADHIPSGSVVNDLIAVPARTGDCHYLPSGTCHALGAGIVVAEIQTPSDTTFRIYDWGRTPETGRPLHIEQALECIQFGRPHRPDKPHIPIETDGLRITPMCDTECFSIERIEALKDADLAIITNGLPEVWMQMIGRARIQTPGAPNVD
jgi:mannose-6-phosphate isomerase